MYMYMFQHTANKPRECHVQLGLLDMTLRPSVCLSFQRTTSRKNWAALKNTTRLHRQISTSKTQKTVALLC